MTPRWVVYKADEWFRFANKDWHPDFRCKSAEYIKGACGLGEALEMVRQLNAAHPHKSANGIPLALYKVCTQDEWDAWERDKTLRELMKNTFSKEE